MSFEPGNNLMRQQRDRYRNELAALRLEFAVVKTRVEALHCENEDLKEELGALRRSEHINTSTEAHTPLPSINMSNSVEVVEINSEAEEDLVTPTQLRAIHVFSQLEATDPPPFLKTDDELNTVIMSDVTGTSSTKESSSSKCQASKVSNGSQMNLVRSSIKDESPQKPVLHKFKKELKEEDTKDRYNIKIKVDEAVILSNDVASTYLSGLHPFNIVPPPLNLIFSRDFLTTSYGCISMGLLWQSKDSAQRLRFIFPTYDINPGMPTRPGDPGYLLSCRQEMIDNSWWSVFSRVQDKPARWAYFGEYHFHLAGQMSSEDFSKQREQVKSKWGQKIIKAKKWPAYRAMRSRILQLKTASNKAAVTSEDKLTECDIIEAFESGAESIGIVSMECVAFNHAFSKELVSKHQTWERAAGLSKGKGKRSRETANDSDDSHDETDLKKRNKRVKQGRITRKNNIVKDDLSNASSEED